MRQLENSCNADRVARHYPRNKICASKNTFDTTLFAIYVFFAPTTMTTAASGATAVAV
eukprot:m.430086 g.430086  ORF g.430086 m.430086 type:complete len:58 (+) comp17113_c0_seq1:1798-1971(+)